MIGKSIPGNKLSIYVHNNRIIGFTTYIWSMKKLAINTSMHAYIHILVSLCRTTWYQYILIISHGVGIFANKKWNTYIIADEYTNV